ncbi:hypothetical protein EDC01DRAFT_152425 [Geopyxis carbonaria]|nr:hypothetical protein EDC01DRAFT_152425 [Geopyxis carbonaria]
MLLIPAFLLSSCTPHTLNTMNTQFHVRHHPQPKFHRTQPKNQDSAHARAAKLPAAHSIITTDFTMVASRRAQTGHTCPWACTLSRRHPPSEADRNGNRSKHIQKRRRRLNSRRWSRAGAGLSAYGDAATKVGRYFEMWGRDSGTGTDR